MITRRRLVALILVWTLPSVVFLATAAFVYTKFRIPQPERLDDADRTAVIATLRAALDGSSVPCTVDRPVADTLAVTVWSKGRAVARIDGHGTSVGAATQDAAQKLASYAPVKAMPVADREAARLQVDVITGSAPLGGIERYAVPGIAEMLAINPGVEGIGAVINSTEVVLLPDELVTAKVLAAKRPSNALPDFAMGIDLARIGSLLQTRAQATSPIASAELFRFRTDTFVERPLTMRPGAPIQLYLGNSAPPPLSGKTLREAALAGGRYLVAHLAPNGRYVYEHDLSTGQQTDPIRSNNYSMPRHAGTTYFLAELYRITKEEWLREPIERAFHHLAELLAAGKCGTRLPDGTEIDCVLDRTEQVAHLGSTALAVVALAEYQRATGDATYLPIATKFASFLLFMQRSDGSFRHLYDSKTQTPDDASELLYYSGEASLALARMYVVTKDERYATAANKGLAWLVHWYDFFMGGFFYGEEHWTCIAAEAAWPTADDPEYMKFCHGYGAFLRAQQPVPGEHPDQNDFAGAYNVTSFVPPYNTPAGSRTEAMISAYLLGKHHGSPDPEVRAQIVAAMQYALGQQIRPENDFNVVGEGLGGMPGSPIDRNVRIDFVQHVCSAMIRASEWIDEP
ncbi:hypothetical protein BH11MYX3_BH11MYX3_29140 [soil metagenome]